MHIDTHMHMHTHHDTLMQKHTHVHTYMPMLCNAVPLADRLNGTLQFIQDGWMGCCAGQLGKYKERGGFNKCNLGVVTSTRWRFFPLSTLILFLQVSANRSVCNVHCVTTLILYLYLLCLWTLLKFFQSAPKWHLVVLDTDGFVPHMFATATKGRWMNTIGINLTSCFEVSSKITPACIHIQHHFPSL